MDDPSTDSLRKLAPTWTLAGDEQLLTILQKTHQRLLSKCQEANSQLEQMTNVLNDASISLQNVNNQFMALSNRQFIESRVYDDDELPTEAAPVKEPPKPEVPDELSGLKRSIAVLESAHELITILQDSDTDTQSDDELPARLVLKPKDMYSSRPLPYIIGSQPWKNKWHAGLVVEDSDSESSGSAREAESDQYSASEPEDSAPRARPPPQHNTVTTVSETSSSLASEPGLAPRPTPADVASEIARRLGATEHPKPIEKESDYDEPAKPTVRKIYRPQDPVSSTVFPDEPPPLSDESEQSDSAESDIFADLHRQQPYARAQVSDELFGFKHREDSDEGDIFSDFKQPANNPIANASSPMFPNRDNRDTHRDHHNAHHTTSVSADTASQHDADKVKKPVGGISLFGNKGTESIGAAILKRNQRKSSSSDAESESDSRSESQTNQQINQTQKDIFDDLFARSEGKKVTKDKVDIVKDIKTEIQKKNEVKEKKVEKPKVDLFSDNLFDDIDDIFSTNVVKMPTKDNVKTKSIFEDDDDLFSEIAAPKPVKVEVATSSNNKKSIFDSDDELFAEETKPKPVEKPVASPKPVVDKPKIIEKPSEPKITKNIPRSIFDDDDDEDDIFSDVKTDKHSDVDKVQNKTPVILEKPKDFSKRVEDTKNIVPPSSSVFKSPSLFDDDDDDDESDLFAEPSKSITVAKNKDIEKVSTKNEVKIPDDILNDDDDEIVSTPVVKSDEITKDKNDNLNIDSKPIESNVNNNINATESIEKSEDSKPLPVSEQLDRNVEINAAKISDHIHRNIQNIEQSSSDTNDFSDQDFDDLPPKEHSKTTIINTKVANETKINDIPKTTKIDDIFDTPPLEDDIFASSEQKIDNKETLYKNIETEIPETLLKDNKKTDKDNKTEQVISKNIEADTFSDILTEPPEFEKPKEPKKSKNVNALFDDDSDDESLFFKKNEPIFEENPQDFTPTQDRIFGLFTDEPPDDEFSKMGDEIDDDMFSTLPKPKIPQNENLPPIPDVNFENNLPVDVSKVLETEKATVDIFNDEKPVHELPKDTSLDKKEEAHLEKLTKTVNMKQESPTVLSDDELFKTATKIQTPNLKPTLDIVSDDEDIFSTVTKAEKPTLLPKPKEEIPVPESNVESVKSSDDELFVAKKDKPVVSENILKDTKITHDEAIFKVPKSKPEITKSDDTPVEVKSEPKKVGKLKVGLNINVNALLPGASPKKSKPNDQTDGQTQSVSEPKPDTKVYPESPKSEPKIPESQTTDSKMIKSVSFDGEPESDILDNKLSKERAKIQVKRRPSTRRARREAVRKSGIDFGEDSTDNSSSIDDPPRKQTEISQKSNLDTKDKENKQTESIEKAEIEPKVAQAEIQPDLKDRTNIKSETTEIDKPYTRDVKSKVVYILNDEDIFNTSPVNKVESTNKDLTSETSKKSQNLESNVGISTLGKVYDSTITKNDETAKNMKSSLFGDENDDDDEEIFKGKSKTVKKATIFDSDSENELFGNKKERKTVEKKVEVKKEVKREVVKGSLFGDDDDDDDLFGVKTKKSVADQKPHTSKPAIKETPKPTEPVFEDPLSMFGDDD